MNVPVRQAMIIDDDDASVSLLTDYLSKLPFFAKPVVCQTVPEALAILSHQAFDLILLDIHLPGLSGMDFLRALPTQQPVVVTTSSPEYAVETYDLNVADFLLKPFTLPRFLRAVGRATHLHLAQNTLTDPSAIFLKIGRKVQRFNFEAIDYVEAYGIYSKVCSNGQVVVVNESISTLEGQLPSHSFLRIHKSFLINLSKVVSYDARQVWIGTTKIPLGETYKEPFQSFLNLLQRKTE
jgi:DNA-binding LytR/AlgR family response regulator